MAKEVKTDMSCKCGGDKWFQLYGDEITKEEYEEWYKENCAKCIYAYEVCMYGEEEDKG